MLTISPLGRFTIFLIFREQQKNTGKALDIYIIRLGTAFGKLDISHFV